MNEPLHAVALDALRGYDIEVADCTFAAQAFNSVFRVDAVDGSRYALRVGAELRIHADGCEEVEAAWVNELHAAGFPVARVVPARNGSAAIAADGRVCVLFEWISGHRLGENPSLQHVRAAGALTAQVHEHGAGYLADRPRAALVADRVLDFELDDHLDELRPRYGALLREAVDRAQQVLDALWFDPPHPPHLLHGDVQPGNVMVEDGRIVLIDFQDLMWGFEIQDVHIALLALSAYEGALGVAFREGYETRRPWPQADPDTIAALDAARHLDILNFGLHLRRPGLDEFIARRAEPVVAWMGRGASTA